MFSKLKQIKDIRQQAKTIQNTLSQERVEATAAWGKIKMVMNGNQEIENISIDPELLDPQKKDEVEKAIKEVVQDGIKKVQKIMSSKIREGNIKLPDWN